MSKALLKGIWIILLTIVLLGVPRLAGLVGTVLPILSSDVVLIKPSDPVWVLPSVSGVRCL